MKSNHLDLRRGCEMATLRTRNEAAAREFLPSFGISHFCGRGRDAEHQLPDLLKTSRAGADRLSASHA
jgi:hypothetical protein